MTHIHGVQPPMGARAVDATRAVAADSAKVQPAGISDVVEISSAAKLAAKIQEIPDVRTELVERVRNEIAAGTYETPEGLEVAVDKLMEELLS